MKLTVTRPAKFQERGGTTVLTDIANPSTCGWCVGRDGTITVALPGRNDHSYALSGAIDDWRSLFMKLEELADTAIGAGLLAGSTEEAAGAPSALFADPHADPTPKLTADVRADMQAAALDAFRTGGFLRDLAGIASAAVLADLTQRYGFTHNQVEALGADAVADARAQWEREGGEREQAGGRAA